MEEMFWKLQENILTKEDLKNLVDYLYSTNRYTQFTQVKKFEEDYSKWQGCKHSVYVNSGSSANLILISALKQRYGWKEGDEIIVPPVTWVTNISPIMQCGLVPVFVDINLEDLSFDYDKLAKSITPRTKGIFVTHLIGVPADMKKINEIAKQHTLTVMEDSCESHGALLENGVKIGNASVASTFSFYWGHHMTTIEGGMLCTDDKTLYHDFLLKRSHGLARELPIETHEGHKQAHKEIDFNFLFLTDGFNFRNTELNATLGISQLKKLDDYIRIRNDNYQRFLEICRPYSDELILIDKPGISSFSLPFIFKKKGKSKEFQKILQDRGIENRPMISGNLLRQPFLKHLGHNHENFPNAEHIHHNSFYIGNNQFVNEERLGVLAKVMQEHFSPQTLVAEQ